MINVPRTVLVSASRKTAKTATVAQGDLFERDLPPLRPTADRIGGEVIVAMIGVAVILCMVALFVTRKLEISV